MAAPREVRKTVTVVFCDVVGSTELGVRFDPETVRSVMSRYFDEMREALERHGGTVEKFIGDAVMAVFGVPVVHEDDALRAALAAVEMRGRLGRLNEELERDHGVRLQIRVGINTGEVLTGAAGETLVTGDPVNVASRLQQAAEPGTILVGEATRALLPGAQAVPLEPLDVRGRVEPVPVWRVEAVAGEPPLARSDTPFVGRHDELAR